MSVAQDVDASRMTPTEIRASVSLASIFGLRMLGLFLILPVFAVHAKSMPGGEDAMLVGLAMGTLRQLTLVAKDLQGLRT